MNTFYCDGSKILNARLLEARNLNDGHTIRRCYFYLQKVEKLQTKVSNSGYTKQASVDLIRKNCMARMLYLFNQVKINSKIRRNISSIRIFESFISTIKALSPNSTDKN